MSNQKNNEPTPEELLKLASSLGKGGKPDPDAAVNAVSKRLSAEKRKQVDEVLSDKAALEKLLKSPEAQRLMEKFGFNK